MSPIQSQSAAHIVIRPRPHATCATVASGDDRVRQLLEDCGPNKNDRALAFIIASIGDGVNTGSAIIARGARFGFNSKHLAMMLSKGSGAIAVGYHWQRQADGTYVTLG